MAVLRSSDHCPRRLDLGTEMIIIRTKVYSGKVLTISLRHFVNVLLDSDACQALQTMNPLRYVEGSYHQAATCLGILPVRARLLPNNRQQPAHGRLRFTGDMVGCRINIPG